MKKFLCKLCKPKSVFFWSGTINNLHSVQMFGNNGIKLLFKKVPEPKPRSACASAQSGQSWFSARGNYEVRAIDWADNVVANRPCVLSDLRSQQVKVQPCMHYCVEAHLYDNIQATDFLGLPPMLESWHFKTQTECHKWLA